MLLQKGARPSPLDKAPNVLLSYSFTKGCVDMPLNHEHQMTVLKDILTNHQCDCCGTIAECEQMERIIKSLMTNDNVADDTRTMLNDVYYYSQSGKYSPDLDQHISNHQNELSQWISGIDSLS
jgi:hypothetical protein